MPKAPAPVVRYFRVLWDNVLSAYKGEIHPADVFGDLLEHNLSLQSIEEVLEPLESAILQTLQSADNPLG